jgi:hypothetical protein
LMITNPLTKGIPPFKFKDHIVKMELGFIIWCFKIQGST